MGQGEAVRPRLRFLFETLFFFTLFGQNFATSDAALNLSNKFDRCAQNCFYWGILRAKYILAIFAYVLGHSVDPI